MPLLKIYSGKGRFSQSGGSFFQNFPWHVGPNHGGSSYVTKHFHFFKRVDGPVIIIFIYYRFKAGLTPFTKIVLFVSMKTPSNKFAKLRAFRAFVPNVTSRLTYLRALRASCFMCLDLYAT